MEREDKKTQIFFIKQEEFISPVGDQFEVKLRFPPQP
jgi:hypothetical protein